MNEIMLVCNVCLKEGRPIEFYYVPLMRGHSIGFRCSACGSTDITEKRA